MGNGSSRTGPQGAGSPPRGHAGSANQTSHRGHPRPRRSGSPDLAAVARETVISFLSAAAAATADHDVQAPGETAAGQAPAGGLAGTTVPGPAEAPESDRMFPAAWRAQAAGTPEAVALQAQAITLRAAAVSVATLDRIEAAAAKLEADIAVARQEQAALQAKAGAAVAEAVRAAQRATDASSQAKRALRLIGRYVVITVVLVIIQLIILVLFASAGH